MFASVILEQAIGRPLDYRVPQELAALLHPGMCVQVPMRGKLRQGIILALKNSAEVADPLPIAALGAQIPADLFELAQWLASYYGCPLYKALKAVVPPPIRNHAEAKSQLFVKPLLPKKQLALLCQELRTQNAAQTRVLEVLLQFPKGILLTALMERADVSRSPIEALAKKNALLCLETEIERSPLQGQEYFQTLAKTLNSEQGAALEKIQNTLKEGLFATHLLHGVTGSGKTEVYLQAIQSALEMGKSSLLLVPEIALTAQTIERLCSRFTHKVALLHHRLSEGERRDAWHQMQQGKIQIAIGVRSALFSPLKNLGLIIVDEEHESSYKQSDESPCYHARDTAVMRAKLCHATVVLGSATPSLESAYNAKTGKYLLSTLSERPAGATLPQIALVDMRERAQQSQIFSDQLLDKIRERLSRGEQTLLFLNRRGFHTAQLCRKCSHVIECPHCDISLTFHKGDNLLACHLCNYTLKPPRCCPQCQSAEGLKYKGYGTEQVEKALHAIFAQVRTLRLDADTTRHKGSHEQLLKQFRSGKADVLIGTQMIAKGLHFPAVTLVAVLNADASLRIPDFRATEQVFQLITQVAGRAGRAELPGEVLIQTSMPYHPTILQAATCDYSGFLAQELASREQFLYPPFSHLIKVLCSGPLESATLSFAQSLRTALISHLPSSCQIHPVIPSGHAKVKDRYRFQFLLRGSQTSPMTAAILQLQKSHPPPRNIQIFVDVDPLSTFF